VSKKPFVSIVIPTFNRAGQVRAALKSVLAQTYREFEVIVVDDGSTDATESVLQPFLGAKGYRGNQVRYIFQPNQGQSAARNKGVEAARGEWIAFLDSDDVWFPEKLDLQVKAIERFAGKSWACITDARWVEDQSPDTTAFRRGGRRYEGTMGLDHEALESLARIRDPFCVSTLLVHAGVAKEAGWFETDIKFAEDHDFLLRLSLVTPFCYVNKPLCRIDQSSSPPGSQCRPWDRHEVRLRGWQSILEKWLKLDSKLSPGASKTIIHNLRCVHSAWANWYLERGRYDDARNAVRAALGYEVTAGLLIKWTLTKIAPGFARKITPKGNQSGSPLDSPSRRDSPHQLPTPVGNIKLAQEP
jgi:glycosyltransferase involved in cell wall biosynthesis